MAWHFVLTIALLADPAPAAAPASTRNGPHDLLVVVRNADTSFQVGGWKSAATGYAKLVEWNPTVGLYWYRLGESLRRLKRYEEALAPLEKAEELGGFQANPPRWVHRGEAAFSLAAVHAALAHKDKAVAWARKSLDQGLRDIRKLQAAEFAQLLEDAEFRSHTAKALNLDGVAQEIYIPYTTSMSTLGILTSIQRAGSYESSKVELDQIVSAPEWIALRAVHSMTTTSVVRQAPVMA